MKLMIENNQILNIVPDDYIAGNPIYDDNFIQIKSIADDVDPEDIKQNRAWKFKIDDKGHLSYDLEKIKQQKIKELKEKTRQKVLELYPHEKQINASFGVYEQSKCDEIKAYIQNVIQLVDAKELEIKGKKKIDTLNAVSLELLND
jgi:hypothetical protein